MDEERRERVVEEGIDLFELCAILWRRKWLILGTSLGAGLFALVITFFMANIYRSEAVIKPVTPEPKSAGIARQLGSLLPGIELGGLGSLEDLEVLLKSRDLTTRVFAKYKLYPEIFKDRYDEKTGKLKPGMFFSCSNKPPGEWDAIREVEDILNIDSNDEKGIITIAFESDSPELSAKVVGYYLEEAKTRLQEQALERARKNKEFLEKQLKIAVDPLIKERLYALFAREVEKEMLAKNREQFAFTIVDPPKVPDRKVKPRRMKIFLSMIIITTFLCFFIIVVIEKRKNMRI